MLASPVPNAAVALAWLSRGETPLLPVAVYRDASTQLTISVGEPFTLPWRGLRATRASGDALTRQVMGALAALLPAELRGPFGEVPDGAAHAPGNADAGDHAMQGDPG
ncbi:MAG: hypothetical protein O3B31_00610 [Chloroflexi bacterium]|nr:hypothetical protein [Chloroflexota bacterium]